MVAPAPVFHVGLVQVLVGQDQSAESFSSVLLDTRAQTGRWSELGRGGRTNDGHVTDVEVSGGDVLQSTAGRVETFVDDGVGSFAVKSQFSFRASHWKQQTWIGQQRS